MSNKGICRFSDVMAIFMLLAYIYCVNAEDTRGRHFVVTIPPFYTSSGVEYMLYISSSEDGQVVVRKHETNAVTLIGNYSVNEDSQVLSIELDERLVIQTEIDKQKRCIEIASTADIAVYVSAYKPGSTAVFTVYPTTVLSTDYTISSYEPLAGYSYDNYLIVTSINEGTSVNISDLNQNNYTAHLGYMESTVMWTSSDSTGARVKSDNLVNVVVGSMCSNIPTFVSSCDTLYDSPVPVSHWGQTFIIPPILPRTACIIRILAENKQNSVNVQYSVHGSATSQNFSFTGMHELQLGTTVTVVTTDKPVNVVQYGVGENFDSTDGDPFIASVPAVKHFSNSYVFSSPLSDKGFTNRIAITIQEKHVNGLKLDGQSLASNFQFMSLQSPEPLSSYRVIVLEISSGNHSLKHTLDNVTFSVFLYGLLSANGFGFYLGFRFDTDGCLPDPCENGATCTDEINDYTCECVVGYTDKKCSTNIDDCLPDPCGNGATCTDEINDYTCECVVGYTDKNCSTNIDDCIPELCENGATCNDGVNDYTCDCVAGYSDKNCSTNIDDCLPDPCENGATCTDEINDYTCECVVGYTDKNCSTNIDDCLPDPCENGATCNDGINDYMCECKAGYTDKNCSSNINDCLPDPCENGAACIDGVNDYTCDCVSGYLDKNCSINIDDCLPEPCENGATCNDGIHDYTCECKAGYTDKNCSTNINDCLPDPCENGATCNDGVNDYICDCVAGFSNKNCSTNIDDCLPDPCENGATCTDETNDYTCECVVGYTDKNCSTNIDDCLPEPCENGATCNDESNDYMCECKAGYIDKNCSTNINDCLPDPCENEATCTDGVNDYSCDCVAGYSAKNCSTNIDDCLPDPCENGATCRDEINDYTCECVVGYTDKNCSTNRDDCLLDPCENGATCNDGINDYMCDCKAGYTDKNCSTNIDDCLPEPCENGATCNDEINDYMCECKAGYTDKNCSKNINDCLPDPCENEATCTDGVNDYSCDCVAGYSAKNCSTNIDDCLPDPCENGATCRDEINDYTCECVVGYTDKNCSTNIDDCLPDLCENGATCNDGINDYMCDCKAGYTDKNCSTNIDDCLPEPCENGAACNDEINDYMCECKAGYTDKNCSTNINDCLPDPCENGAACIDGVDDYTCDCVSGYSDKNCSTNIDDCLPEPCENGATCNDGINDYTCECKAGYTDKNCSTNINDWLPDPCENGVTCNDGVNDYICDCVAGYSNKNCSTNIDDCLPDPCENGATCRDEINDYTCECVVGYTDKTCSTNIDDCLPDPCENGATCNDGINDYICYCKAGYTDKNCYTNINDCLPDPCENGATCNDGVNDYICDCVAGYSDKNCSTNIDDCLPDPCENGASCTDETNDYTCECVVGYTDKNCSTNIDECASLPCEHSGTCIDLVDDFKCMCVDGFTGKTCRPGKLGDDCSTRPGVCVNIPYAECNNTICVCKTGFESRTESNGTCSRVDCFSVPKIDYGDISLQHGYDTKYGSIATVDCYQGFEPSEPTITCQADKTWTVSTCNRKNCSVLVAPEYGNILKHNGSYFESVITFTCNFGYMLVGNASIMCTSYGIWNSDVPLCIAKVPIGEACASNDICRTSGAICVDGICSCKTGIHNEAFDVCDAMFLFPYGVSKGDQVMKQTDDSCSQPVPFNYGIPIFEHAYTTAFVCTNGLITLNITYSNPVPSRNISLYGKRTFVAPFYADTDIQTSGSVYYRSHDVLHNAEEFQNADVKYVESMVKRLGSKTAFSAKFILFATWDKVKPFQDMFNKTNEATFQAVIVTDGIDTFTLFIYGYRSMLWTIPITNEIQTHPDIWIGYTASGKYSSTNVNSFKTTALTIDSHALTKGISGLLFSPLTRIGARQPNAAIKCIDWFNGNKDRKSHFHTTSESRMPDCPCNLDSLSFDPWYWPPEGIENDKSALNTVEILPSQLFGYAGKSCTYDKATGLWSDEIPKAGGFYIYHPLTSPKNHVIHDTESKQFCCEESSLCHLYYELHPVGNCYTQTWFETGISWGDPHFVTLDKKSFTFNGLGEYYLIKLRANSTSFDLQTRTARAVRKDGTQSYATIFKAFAAKDHTNASFQAELNNHKDGLILYANGADLSLLYNRNTRKSFRYKSEENNVAIIRKNDTLVVFFPNTGISLNVSVGVQMLSISATVPKKYKNNTEGLLGNFDGDPDNDLFTPNGTFLPEDSDDKKIYNYGQTWQINKNNSVFEYSEGLSTADYSNATYTPKFIIDAIRENKTKVKEAMRICGGDHNIQCVFDYVFTDDEKVAEHTKATKETADEASKEIGKRIPTLGGCDILYITKGEEVSCTLKIQDEEELYFHFIDNSVGASFNIEQRQIIYRQDNDLPVNISISAVNNDNKTSTPFRVSVRLCTGCNGHGICTDNIRNDPRETQYFKYRECECEPQYQGLDCEEEYNGCAASPCSMERECTPLSATEQITRNKTHLCGACPNGTVEEGDKCRDIDECEEQQPLCEHVCVNTEGTFQCICNHGYRARSGDSSHCYDINECDEALHNCTQECINTNGGFDCSCKEGFEFNASSWTCIKADVNVCQEADIDCSETSGCTVNKNSDPVCFCESGFKLTENGTSCKDADECETNVCPQKCNNFFGGFSCSCYAGFKVRDKTSCQECVFPFWGNNCENECKCSGQGTFDCDPVHGCVCKGGWYGDTCDDDIDECVEIADPCNDVRKQCINIPGGYTCTCRSGFVEEIDQCIDIDECSSPLLHDCTQTCSNTIGGFTCGCYSGYTKYDSRYCQDFDECALKQHSCEQKCQNFPGLYNCYCHFGYILNDDRRTCTKVSDPCKVELNLTCSHFCVLSIDSAECHCQEGYNLASDKQSCLDVDECSNDELNLCSNNAECINVEGSYFCDCPKGSKLENDGRTCFECDQFHYGEDCSQECSCLNGHCDRVIGCICDPGWVGQNCDKDFDECSGNICKESNKECVNMPGSFLCRCKLGYKMENGVCTDVDECSDVKENVCDQICTNTDGSYACSCETGFSFHSGKCEDLNECAGISKCDQTCDNTVGSYRCSCRDGYQLDTSNRQSCIAKNKCNETEEDECSEKNAECIVTNGKSDCSCQKGFIFNDNDFCKDIKECSEIPTPCTQLCLEKDGGFSCACEKGFNLLQDGITCQECEKGSFGVDCQLTCACSLHNTRSCDPVNGSCDCIDGWKGETCDDDINECELVSLYECPDNAECVNTDGSFSCKCDIGFLKTADGVCEICDRQWFGEDCSSICSCQSENTDLCNNIDGKCTCITGWNGENCTEDVDECEQNMEICSVKDHTICHNTLGSYKCECAHGYFSQNNMCRDKNECLHGTADCLQDCINTDGGYICKCTLGHQGYWNSCKECSGNRHGENCTGACQCNATNALNGLQSCDIRSGQCLCKPEWEGDTCEADVNECSNDRICAEKKHSYCTNFPGTYKCDCQRGFNQKGDNCVAEEITTFPPVSEGSTNVDLLIRIAVLLPEYINLDTSVGYNIVEQNVRKAILTFFRRYTSDMFELRVNNIWTGSIIVNFTIIYPTSNTDLAISLANAAVDLSTGSMLEYNGQLVSAALTGTFDNTSNVCEIYTIVRGPCPQTSECSEDNGLPKCREIPVQDNFSVFLGLGAGVCLIILMLMIFAFVVHKIRDRRERQKQEGRHIDRLHRGPQFQEPSLLVGKATRNEPKITTKPQFQNLREKRRRTAERQQHQKGMVWLPSSQSFGLEKRQGLLPRLHSSLLRRPEVPNQGSSWQPDQDIPEVFLN